MKGKHIVLGITGGIAAYKAATLTRLFVKAGAEVQVVMTPNAREFIAPLTLSTLSDKPVITEFFTANTGQWNSHVDLGLWADALVIAPATASTIAKMANGVADNMLVTTYLSAKAPVFIAPAMDLDMMQHPSTVANINRLKSYGNHIIEATAGELASHLVGKGRMEEPENIFRIVDSFFNTSDSLKGKKVLITAGPTQEPIDPVRFIGNYSTGKMGFAIANEATRRGAQVTVISGPVDIPSPDPSINVIRVMTANEMNQAAIREFPDADIAILAAAVADYAPEEVSDVKIKREHLDKLTLKLKRNPDIAANLGKMKDESQILVGFALETDHEKDNAQGKLQRKRLDLIVLNSLRNPGAGFGTDTNVIEIFDKNGNVAQYPLKVKKEVACDILDAIEKYAVSIGI